MVKLRVILLSMVIFALAWCGAAWAGGASPTADESRPKQQFVVIVHASTQVESLSASALRALFLGQSRYWRGGQQVELVLCGQRQCPSREVIVSDVLNMSEAGFQQYWLARLFSQRAVRPPRTGRDRETVVAMVAGIPGAISLVEDGALPEGVRVVGVPGLFDARPAEKE